MTLGRPRTELSVASAGIRGRRPVARLKPGPSQFRRRRCTYFLAEPSGDRAIVNP